MHPDQLILRDVQTSKLKVDNGVGQFMVAFNLKHFKKCGGSLDELTVHLNKFANITIEPMQQEIRDENTQDMFQDNEETQEVNV